MPVWDADIELNDEIAARLIADSFPQLAPIHLRLLGSGWDNHAYVVNDRYVFRIPHRRMADELMQTWNVRCSRLLHSTNCRYPSQTRNTFRNPVKISHIGSSDTR